MSIETTKPKHIMVPRGLSQHGLPKTPGISSPDGSIKSYRFTGPSPPLSPRTFLALFRSEDSPRSNISAVSSLRDSSPSKTPAFPPVPEIEPSIEEKPHVAPSCPTCGSCKIASVSAHGPDKENEPPYETTTSHTSLTKLAHRIKAALVTKQTEEVVKRRRPRQPKLRRVETTHWTEM